MIRHEAIETKKFKKNRKSNNNDKPIVNRLNSSIKIKSKRNNFNSPYKPKSNNQTIIWKSTLKKPIINFIIDNIPNIEILVLKL